MLWELSCKIATWSDDWFSWIITATSIFFFLRFGLSANKLWHRSTVSQYNLLQKFYTGSIKRLNDILQLNEVNDFYGCHKVTNKEWNIVIRCFTEYFRGKLIGHFPPRGPKINYFLAKFFRGNKNIYLNFYVIPPHWHDTGSWNPSLSKTRIYLLYIVNIMAADVLATKGSSASATMILT